MILFFWMELHALFGGSQGKAYSCLKVWENLVEDWWKDWDFFCCVILVFVPYFTCIKITNTPCVLAVCRDLTIWTYFILPTVLRSMGTSFSVPQMWKHCTEKLSDGCKATQCLNPSGCEVQAFNHQAIVAAWSTDTSVTITFQSMSSEVGSSSYSGGLWNFLYVCLFVWNGI